MDVVGVEGVKYLLQVRKELMKFSREVIWMWRKGRSRKAEFLSLVHAVPGTYIHILLYEAVFKLKVAAVIVT